jgi:hypothetical protein
MSLEWITIALAAGSLATSLVTLLIARQILKSARRSRQAGDERLEILREQQERLAYLYEERRQLLEALERQQTTIDDTRGQLEPPANLNPELAASPLTRWSQRVRRVWRRGWVEYERERDEVRRQLEATEKPGAAETATEGAGNGVVHPEPRGASQRRSWWRRFFGFK